MIPDDNDVEAAQINLHINQERDQNKVFDMITHISAVDPTTNRIKGIIPHFTNDNQIYMETGWIPLGTPAAGNRYGIQILPFGGASVTDPTGQDQNNNGNQMPAEQVLVHILGHKKGLHISGVQTFNAENVPPSGYQDKSGVQAAAGEWLFKHASGSYLYFSNTGELTLQSFTNPAPVLQTNQSVQTANQIINLKALADGNNASLAGQSATNAIFNLSAASQNGTTNNATGNIVVDATSLGTGTLNITVNGQNSTLNVSVDGRNNTYNLTVANGTVNVTSDTANIKSDTVNLGTGTMQRILTDISAQVYNSHTHSGVMSGSSDTGVPNQTITSESEAQNANAS